MSAPKKRGYLVIVNPAGHYTQREFTGKQPTLKELQDAVGGMIERVKVKYKGRKRDGYVNEEGALKPQSFARNMEATRLYWEANPFYRETLLHGSLVIIYWVKEEPAADEKPASRVHQNCATCTCKEIGETPPPKYNAPLSEWLATNTSSHEIFDSALLGAQFLADMGVKADWPDYSHADTARSIRARGKGGELAADKGQRMAYGYAIAEHFAARHAGWKPWQNGLGFRWSSALEALRKAGY